MVLHQRKFSYLLLLVPYSEGASALAGFNRRVLGDRSRHTSSTHGEAANLF
ncbi:hypothetical protein HYC85_029150 [Camellia sinensis]|uniref:Uncharacterized protein n=1 Tax=Camellia sinensis TaxID=4442 RepID=A0A7J7FXF3_CAMSI|nr:hypothetical protein HYC85_029150 [Camellia sinensis]